MAHIEPDFLELLLERREGDDLDFKEGQYPRETVGQKAKVIKDVLALANTWWPLGDAYILRGVREVDGQRAEVLGVDEHPREADLQQLINEKTNAPVKFEYISTTLEGKSVGVFRIARDQPRPIYLKARFGELGPREVYIRRGSSNTLATPEDLVRMGKAQADKASDIRVEVELRDSKTGKRVGPDNPLRSTVLRGSRPATKAEQAEFQRKNQPPAPGFWNARFDAISMTPRASIVLSEDPSPDAIAEYRKTTTPLIGVELVVMNVGRVLADDIELRCSVIGPDVIRLFDTFPQLPESSLFVSERLTRSSTPFPQDLTVTNRDDQSREVWADIGKIKPQDERCSSEFWLGATVPCTVRFEGRVLGDDIPVPITFSFEVPIEVSTRTFTDDDMRLSEGDLDE